MRLNVSRFTLKIFSQNMVKIQAIPSSYNSLVCCSNTFIAVPEYHVVHPIQVDEEGAFVSHELTFPRIRMRRSAGEVDNEEVHYKVSAFGNDLHLHLKRNKRLLAPGFKVEVIGKRGRVIKRHTMENCHYTGRLKGRTRTTVAISNCLGLVCTQ